MVEERLTDGRRIAQLLASEVTGHGGDLAGVSVTDADPSVEPTPDGTLAYGIDHGGDRVASAFVQPDRVRVEFTDAVDVAADAASGSGLRIRSKAVEPPTALVFVEDGAEVKRLLSVLRAVAAA